jgi:hypothetical protein
MSGAKDKACPSTRATMGGSNCSKIGREKSFVRSSTNALRGELCCKSKHRWYADHANSVLRNGLGPRGFGFGFEAMGMMRDRGLIHDQLRPTRSMAP